MEEIAPNLVDRLRWTAMALCAMVGAVALLALIGWAADVEPFTRVSSGLASMKVNTALSLLLAAVALAIRSRWQGGRLSLLADVLAAAAFVLPAMTAVEYLVGVDLHIDQMLIVDPVIPPHGHPGRMSMATACCLVLISLAVVVQDRLLRNGQILAIACMVIALLGLLGYTYGIPSLYRIFAYSSMALHTATSLLLLSIAHLMSRPQRGLHQLLVSDTVGGKLARRVLPATVVVPLVVGWLRLQGQRMGWYDTEFGVALFALSNIIIVATIVWWNAKLLDRSMVKQREAEKDRDELLIREQMARARAEKALSARDQLLSVVSHELRTPLTPVLLMAASIEHRTQLPSDVQEDIRMIREQIELEAHLIDGLLDLTSLQQGKITLEKTPVDVNEVARRAVALFGRLAESHGVDVVANYDDALPRVHGDLGRLQQVAANLFSNAIKFSPRGGRITLTTRRSGETVCLEVRDTGVGISPDTMERLFHPFEQGDASTTRRFGGLGIGLAISRKLIELHGGEITASSEGAERGAAFTVCLPRADGLPPEPPKEAAPLAILLVDDNRMTVKALQRILQGHGHRISIAVSARQALDTALAEPLDLIISDIGLPDLSGWEMMKQLRQAFETRGRKPLRGIAISGFVDNDDRQKSLESGFVAHLAKPIDVNQLIDAVNTALTNGVPATNGR